MSSFGVQITGGSYDPRLLVRLCILFGNLPPNRAEHTLFRSPHLGSFGRTGGSLASMSNIASSDSFKEAGSGSVPRDDSLARSTSEGRAPHAPTSRRENVLRRELGATQNGPQVHAADVELEGGHLQLVPTVAEKLVPGIQASALSSRFNHPSPGHAKACSARPRTCAYTRVRRGGERPAPGTCRGFLR